MGEESLESFQGFQGDGGVPTGFNLAGPHLGLVRYLTFEHLEHVAESGLVEGVLDGLTFRLPCIVALCKSESIPHQVLVNYCVEVGLLDESSLALEQVFDHVGVLHDHADDPSIDDSHDRVIGRIEGLAVVLDCFEQPPSPVD